MVADTIAAIACGSAEPEVVALLGRMVKSDGPSSIIGTAEVRILGRRRF